MSMHAGVRQCMSICVHVYERVHVCSFMYACLYGYVCMYCVFAHSHVQEFAIVPSNRIYFLLIERLSRNVLNIFL